MPVFQALPAPLRGDAQHRIGQRRQVIGDLLDGDVPFNIACQGAEGFRVVGAAQQVQQVFVVVLSGRLQCGAAALQLGLELGGIEAFVHQRITGQFINHARVLQHVTGGPFGGPQQVHQLFVHGGALLQQGEVAFAAQQRLHPVGQAHGGDLAHLALGQPLRGALQQHHQAGLASVAQVGVAGIALPLLDALAHAARQLGEHGVQFRGCRGLGAAALAGAAALGIAQQFVEFLGHQLPMGIELVQEGAFIVVAQGSGHPVQVVVARGQYMGLLVVQVLDAVLHLAQKGVGIGKGLGGRIGHQACAGKAPQCFEGRAAAQLGELSAAYHLQQLHDELDLADAAAREFDVIGALRVPGAALGCMLADLAVQVAQRVEHRIVEVAAEHKGQHHATQCLHVGRANVGERRDDAAFHPGKALPFAAVGLQVVFQRRQRDGRRARVAVGAQHQVDAKDETVLGGVANQLVDPLDGAQKVLVVAELAPPVWPSGGIAVLFVHIDQVDVAGDIELARAQLAHADHPELHRLAIGALRRAVRDIQLRTGGGGGGIECQLGQLGDAAGHRGKGGVVVAVQIDQALHHQLAQDA
ncbi:hypothetical protein D3C72_1035760 [compost metagenome]